MQISSTGRRSGARQRRIRNCTEWLFQKPSSASGLFPSIHGFSLIELLVVLVIIGIASAVVVPRLGGSMGNMRLKTASKKIAASLRYARSQATSGGISYVAIFDLDKGKISITPLTAKPEGAGEKDDGGDNGDNPKAVGYDLPDGVRLQKAISANGEVVSGLFEIFFSPGGSSSGGDVILINERGRRLKIGVDFITGSVKLADIQTHKRR